MACRRRRRFSASRALGGGGRPAENTRHLAQRGACGGPPHVDLGRGGAAAVTPCAGLQGPGRTGLSRSASRQDTPPDRPEVKSPSKSVQREVVLRECSAGIVGPAVAHAFESGHPAIATTSIIAITASVARFVAAAIRRTIAVADGGAGSAMITRHRQGCMPADVVGRSDGSESLSASAVSALGRSMAGSMAAGPLLTHALPSSAAIAATAESGAARW